MSGGCREEVIAKPLLQKHLSTHSDLSLVKFYFKSHLTKVSSFADKQILLYAFQFFYNAYFTWRFAGIYYQHSALCFKKEQTSKQVIICPDLFYFPGLF